MVRGQRAGDVDGLQVLSGAVGGQDVGGGRMGGTGCFGRHSLPYPAPDTILQPRCAGPALGSMRPDSNSFNRAPAGTTLKKKKSKKKMWGLYSLGSTPSHRQHFGGGEPVVTFWQLITEYSTDSWGGVGGLSGFNSPPHLLPNVWMNCSLIYRLVLSENS